MRTLGEHHEAAEVTARGKLEEVQAVHRAHLNTGKVAEGLADTVVVGIHHQGATALHMATVAHLALARADLAGRLGLLNILERTNLLEELDSLLGLVNGLDRVVNNEGALCHLTDAVTTGHHKRGQCRCSESRADSVPALVYVDLAVPLAPGLGWVEHAPSTAHVTEGSLAGTVCATAGNTGDTRDSATSSPGLGRGLVTGVLVDGVRLTPVLVHGGVHELNDIRADGRQEDGRELCTQRVADIGARAAKRQAQEGRLLGHRRRRRG